MLFISINYMLLNELLGIHREKGDKEKGLDCCGEVYIEIGENLQQEYDKLTKTYKDITWVKVGNSSNLQKVGVFKISEFYESLIGRKTAPKTTSEWISIQETALELATNGEVYKDNIGEFTKFRNSLSSHYPVDAYVRKLADTYHLVSQTGQYNFKRTILRKDLVTAKIVLSKFISNTIVLIFLLNRTFTPFYKWKYRKLKELTKLSNIAKLIEDLEIIDPKIEQLIEQIFAKIIFELKFQGFIKSKSKSNNNSLDLYINEIVIEYLTQ